MTAAASLLASVTLPPGSTSSPVEPAGDDSGLARPESASATPNLVDDHGWWVLPGTPSAAITWIKAHPPQGAKLNLTGSATVAPGFRFVGYDRGPVTHVLLSQSVVIEVVKLSGGDTGLRVDAQVVWITPRPVDERIPSGAVDLKVSVTRGRQVLQPSFTITNLTRIQRAASLIDALPAAQPGTSTCDDDSGVADRLIFQSAAGRPLTTIAADPSGCEDVTVVIGGRTQATLTSDAFPGSGRPPHLLLAAQLDSALGKPLRNPSSFTDLFR